MSIFRKLKYLVPSHRRALERDMAEESSRSRLSRKQKGRERN